MYNYVPIVLDCSNGDVRLVGGTNFTEGRVELCLSNEWGTVCDNMWTNNDASVVCRQLQLGSTGTYIIWYVFLAV